MADTQKVCQSFSFEKNERTFIMEKNSTTTTPRMMTIRQIAKTGLLSENALRTMVKDGRAPHIMIGAKALVNFDKLCQMLEEC